MPVQAGENSPWRHQLTGLIPAMGMAEAGGISLTLAVKDRVQSANRRVITGTSFKHGMFFISQNVLEAENPLQVSGTTTTPLSRSV